MEHLIKTSGEKLAPRQMLLRRVMGTPQAFYSRHQVEESISYLLSLLTDTQVESAAKKLEVCDYYRSKRQGGKEAKAISLTRRNFELSASYSRELCNICERTIKK